MNIVVDTNIIISGIFFGGNPKRIINAILDSKVNAYISKEILNEYFEIINEMMFSKGESIDLSFISLLIDRFNIIETTSKIDISRDPDDNKFIECAIDSNSIYIVSGDDDLLSIKNYHNIEIITAKEFCERHLK